MILTPSDASISLNVAPAEITLGGLFPLTGSLSGSGVERDATFRMAVNEINHRSDILPNTVLKYEIRDTGTNPVIGATVAQQLADADVFGVVGAASSSVSMAAAQVLEVAKIPQISYSSTNPALSNKTDYPYFLRVVGPDSLQARALAHIIYNELGNLTVATISPNTAYAGWLIPVFESEFTSLGGTITSSQQFITGASDVTTELQAIFDSGTKTIVMAAFSDDATTVFSQANSVGINPSNGFQWLGTDGLGFDGLLGNSTVATAMSGMIGITNALGSGDLFIHYKDMWECGDPAIYSGAGDRTPNAFATFAYDAVYAFAWAAHEIIDHQSGDISDGENLLQLLKEINYQGATGSISFDENQDREGAYSILNLGGSVFENVALWSAKDGFDQFGTITLSNGKVITGSGDPDPSLDPIGHIADCSQFEFNEATYTPPVTTQTIITEISVETTTERSTETSTEVSIITESDTVTVHETVSTDFTSTTVVSERKAEVPIPSGFIILSLSFVILIHRRRQNIKVN
ncbi:MAG: ABC transporter substrate-binding protein [Candidatus Kariarchaeaceae archaeon]